MNKQVFRFYFNVGFRRMLPNYGRPRSMLIDFLVWLPVAVAFALDDKHKKMFALNGDDIPTILYYWIMFGLVAVGVCAITVGLITGLWMVKQFKGYLWIERAPGLRAFKLTAKEHEQMAFDRDTISDHKERIIASANLHKDGTIWAVMRPGRHHHCHWIAHEQGGSDRTLKSMGFLTNKGRYLNRQEARALAMKNGQCPKPDHHRDLFSEDLWDTPAYLRQEG